MVVSPVERVLMDFKLAIQISGVLITTTAAKVIVNP